MGMELSNHSCFFRTNTSEGGISRLPELGRTEEIGGQGDALRVIYIKSGYGGAASRLMGEAAQLALDRGDAPHVHWDAPGKERRCAVVFPQHNLCLMDAEYPYCLETKLPGAGEELLSLDSCRDNGALREQREELQRLQNSWRQELLRAGRFLRAARAMKKDMRFSAAEAMDLPKLERYASRFAARRFSVPNGRVGKESRRFLTAVTGQGLLLRRSGLEQEYPNAVIMEDEYGAAPVLWNLLRGYALGNGIDVISCPCVLFPHGEPEHLLLPGLGLACFTANRRHPIEINGAARMQAGRFFDKEALKERQCRMRFCRRTMRELLAEAYQAQAAADEARAALDVIYESAEVPGKVEEAARGLL